MRQGRGPPGKAAHARSPQRGRAARAGACGSGAAHPAYVWVGGRPRRTHRSRRFMRLMIDSGLTCVDTGGWGCTGDRRHRRDRPPPRPRMPAALPLRIDWRRAPTRRAAAARAAAAHPVPRKACRKLLLQPPRHARERGRRAVQAPHEVLARDLQVGRTRDQLARHARTTQQQERGGAARAVASARRCSSRGRNCSGSGVCTRLGAAPRSQTVRAGAGRGDRWRIVQGGAAAAHGRCEIGSASR